MTVNDFLRNNVEVNPGKVYVFYKDQPVTYSDFDTITNKVANGLVSLGVKKGDRIAIFLPNSLEFLYSMFGCFKIGGVIVPLNIAYSPDEVKYVLDHSESDVLITDLQLLTKIGKIKAELQSVKHILIVGDKVPEKSCALFSDFVGCQEGKRPEGDVKEEDNISIIYTSGTTGKPKGVVLTHGAYVSAAKAWNETIGITSGDLPMSVLALFHINAQLYFAIGAMELNTSLVLEERFSSSRFWQRAIETNATVSCLPGNALAMLYNMPESELDKKHKIRVMISAYTPLDIYRKFEDRFNLNIVEGYTLTESPSALFNRPGDLKIGSIGKPMPGVEAKIVDEEDNEVPQGEVGEIILKGPAVMKEYFKNPEATSEALWGGWLHTGDLGRVDEDGYFHFAGRKKDIIRRGGENIGAQEVEEVLNSHPKILESAVIAVPDKIRNEEIKAFVIVKAGETLKPEEIIKYCEERLADFKVPRYIEFTDSFPKTAKMTIQKHILKQLKEDQTVGCFDRTKMKS